MSKTETEHGVSGESRGTAEQGAGEICVLGRGKTWIAVIKPAGISSEADGMGGRIAEALHLPAESVYTVHRLDREVGGVMVYALTKKAAAFLSQAAAERSMRKIYLARVMGIPEDPEGLWEDLLFHDRTKNKTYVVNRDRRGVKPARLSYRVLRILSETPRESLLEIALETGRTHQIRVQCAHRGLPLRGDRRYGGKGPDGPCLFAWKLSFPDPDTGGEKSFTAPLPEWADQRTCS